MCTRRENLKRHSQRFHDGNGKPLLRYILGSSIIIPEDSTEANAKVFFHDEYRKPKSNGNNSNNTSIKQIYKELPQVVSNVFNPHDPLYAPILEAMDARLWVNSHYPSLNQKPAGPTGPTQFLPQPPFAYSPNSQYGGIPTYDFHDTTKFGVDICLNCLTIIFSVIQSDDYNVENKHVCAEGRENAFRRLGAAEYLSQLRDAEYFARSKSRTTPNFI